MQTLDMVLTFGSIIVGILLLTGHGSVFMKGGDNAKRQKLYDEKKMEKASGIGLLLIGIATGIDSYTTSAYAKIAYIVVILLIFAVMVYYMKTKCKK